MTLNEEKLRQIVRDIVKEQVTQGGLDRAAATLARHSPLPSAASAVTKLPRLQIALQIGRAALSAVPVWGWVGITAATVGVWLLSKSGGDPEKAAAMVKNNPIRAAAIIRDKAMAKGKFPLVIQGSGGPKVKVFDTREELNAHIEKMKVKKAEPDVEPIKISKKRSGGRKKRCSGKGYGKYKMPANIPYKSFNKFYAALAGNTAALKALGRKDCRWGPKHNKAHGILKGTDTASAVAGTVLPPEPKCPPGQEAYMIKSIGKWECGAKPKDESLAGLKDDPIFNWSGPGKTENFPLGPSLQEQRYDRLMERLIKEIKKS